FLRTLHPYPTRRSSDLKVPVKLSPKIFETLLVLAQRNRQPLNNSTSFPAIFRTVMRARYGDTNCNTFGTQHAARGETILRSKRRSESTRLNSSHQITSY